MEKNLTNDLNRKMSVVIALLLRMLPRDTSLSLRDQISLLNDLGLRPVEISGVIGRTQKYVNKELAHKNKIKRTRKEVNQKNGK